MIKYICKYSERIDTNDFCDSINILKGNLYLIEYVNKHIYYLYDINARYLGEIWGTITDYFVTSAEYREIRIDEILND